MSFATEPFASRLIAASSDGAFAEEGCPELQSDAARRECTAGADSMDEALVTLS